jgi:hypothetical protein
MIEAGLYQLLASTPDVNTATSGIYPVILPESVVFPESSSATSVTALTYRALSSVPTYTLDGTPMITTRVEYTAWSSTYATAKTASEAIRSTLDRYTGTLPNGIAVALCWRTGVAVDSYDTERRAYTSSLDFRVTHSPQ